MALNNVENCKELAKYFEKLLNCPEPTNKFPPLNNNNNTNLDSQAPDETEIARQIKRLKSNKASVEDGIAAEFLKSAGPNTIKEITQLIKHIFKQKESLMTGKLPLFIHWVRKETELTLTTTEESLYFQLHTKLSHNVSLIELSNS